MTMAMKIGDFVDVVDLSGGLEPCVRAVPEAWMLVRVRPNRERHVEQRLGASGICCYLPAWDRHQRIGQWKQWTISRTRRIRTPIFPGLIFVPDFDASLPLLQGITSDVGGFVRLRDVEKEEARRDPFAGCARMSHALFLQLREMVRSFDRPQSRKGFKPGDVVRIREGGPFALWSGQRGPIARLDARGRLRVLLQIMQREVHVDGLTVDQVEPV